MTGLPMPAPEAVEPSLDPVYELQTQEGHRGWEPICTFNSKVAAERTFAAVLRTQTSSSERVRLIERRETVLMSTDEQKAVG